MGGNGGGGVVFVGCLLCDMGGDACGGRQAGGVSKRMAQPDVEEGGGRAPPPSLTLARLFIILRLMSGRRQTRMSGLSGRPCQGGSGRAEGGREGTAV